MRKFYKLFFCVFVFICFICTDVYALDNSSSYTVAINNEDTNFSLSKNLVNLVYKNIGSNTYKYNGRHAITCKSSDRRYVTCEVDSTNKKIIVTPIKVTKSPVTITVSIASKYRNVKNNASILYEDGEKVFLSELNNPVDVKSGSDVIKVPNTGSTIAKIGIITGVGLAAYGGYIIYRRYTAKA